MDDEKNTTGRGTTEGVRIIGAEEAAAAVENGAVTKRSDDELRFGDVPPSPEGPRPAVSFPLPDSVDPADVSVPPVATDEEEPSSGLAAAETGLPHWTEPATGEVPAILLSDDDVDADASWAGVAGKGPTWRDQSTGWDDDNLEDALSISGEDEAIGVTTTTEGEAGEEFRFDAVPDSGEPTAAIRIGDSFSDADPISISTTPVESAEEPEEPESARPITTRSRQAAPFDGQAPSNSGRNVAVAVATGAAFGFVAYIAFQVGPVATLLLATAVVLFAAVEIFDVLRRAGYRPATLLGLVGVGGIMLASYAYGEQAIPLVMVLMMAASFLWYLTGVAQARPTVSIAATLFGFVWAGVFGSFAALLLALPDRTGIAYLAGAILATVAYDTGAYLVGSQVGQRPLAAAISPNKTWEGAMGGTLAAVVVGALIVSQIHPWSFGDAFLLALVVSVAAPLGDLCESMIKRDIGVKDMGSMLPGHGGLMDRFDALLFVLPATYYLVRVLS